MFELGSLSADFHEGCLDSPLPLDEGFEFGFLDLELGRVPGAYLRERKDEFFHPRFCAMIVNAWDARVPTASDPSAVFIAARTSGGRSVEVRTMS